MSRYNSYYPGGMMAAGRCGASNNRSRMGTRSDMGRPNPCPQPSCPPSYCPPEPCPPVLPPVCLPDCPPPPKPICPAPCGDSLPVAMAYVSWQNWECPYEPETALSKGTIFPSLDLPFLAYKGARA